MNTLVCFALVASAVFFYYLGRASAWKEASAILAEVEAAFQEFMQDHEKFVQECEEKR